jgi:pyruvate dehydrogenase E1 component beta subunit
LEVVDVRSIAPLDHKTISESVKKTGHCVIADNDWVNYGASAEIAAKVYESCYADIKSPITRIGYAEAHCPCTRPLEDKFYPNAIKIIRAVEEKLGLSRTDLSGEDFYSYENKFKGPF